MIATRWRRLANVDGLGALFLLAVVLFHIALYWTSPLVPSHTPQRGWELWWDQGCYLKSARALFALDFSEAKHWYPIGYSLLAAPFIKLFDDPFLVPNFVSVIAFAWAFHRYFRPLIGIAGVGIAFFGALVLPISTLIPYEVRYINWLEFVIPWNTVPIAALLMGILCVFHELRPDDGLGKDFLLGALTGAVAAIKPVELLPLAVIGSAYLAVTLRSREHPWRRLAVSATGILATAAPVFGLSFYIHHGFSSPYTQVVNTVGMSLADLPERAIDIFIDAGPSFGQPDSALVRLLPWFPILAPLALVGAALRPRDLLAPVALVAAEMLTYLAYNDFSPLNVTRFLLIHYIVWTFPVIAAAGIATIVSARSRPRWAIACAIAVLAGCALSSLRVAPKAAPYSNLSWRTDATGRSFDLRFADATALDAIDIPVRQAFDTSTIWRIALSPVLDSKPLDYHRDYRIAHLPGRWRMVFTHPVQARHLTFRLPGIRAEDSYDIDPVRFSLRFAGYPWAPHSADPRAVVD